MTTTGHVSGLNSSTMAPDKHEVADTRGHWKAGLSQFGKLSVGMRRLGSGVTASAWTPLEPYRVELA